MSKQTKVVKTLLVTHEGKVFINDETAPSMELNFENSRLAGQNLAIPGKDEFGDFPIIQAILTDVTLMLEVEFVPVMNIPLKVTVQEDEALGEVLVYELEQELELVMGMQDEDDDTTE